MAIGTPLDLGHAVSTSSGATLAITTINAVAAGSAIILWWALTTGFQSVTGVVDSGGVNVYTTFTTPGTAGTSPCGGAYCANAAALASGGTITATLSTTLLRIGISAITVPGMDIRQNMVFDARDQATLNGASATAATSISTPSLSSNNELVTAVLWTAAVAPGVISNTPGFTAIGGTTSGAVLLPYYQIVTTGAATAWAPTWVTAASWRTFIHPYLGAQAANTSRQAQGTLTHVGV
jgi:hypothetical protein